tara:strand:+ start:652 stop:753 length:102 start_codon:yes stop_codon:yes gene_type:complete
MEEYVRAAKEEIKRQLRLNIRPVIYNNIIIWEK